LLPLLKSLWRFLLFSLRIFIYGNLAQSSSFKSLAKLLRREFVTGARCKSNSMILSTAEWLGLVEAGSGWLGGRPQVSRYLPYHLF
jgi:hypothetical protein